MATTTNYAWETPDDTDLVKDGAAAIRTLGSSIDTTTKALNPSTTLGDIEYRSATANTNTRLGIGTSGQVLTVSGGVPEWATASSGGMTLLSTTTLSGASTTISGISGSYTNLFVFVSGVTNATASGYFRLAPNGNTSISSALNFLTGNANDPRLDTYLFLNLVGRAIDRTNSNNAFSITIENYSSTSTYKTVSTTCGFFDTTPQSRGGGSLGMIQTNSAITSLVFSNDSGNLSTGTVLVYGVK
jgi:hypothetical protein